MARPASPAADGDLSSDAREPRTSLKGVTPDVRDAIVALHRIRPWMSAWLYLRTWLLIIGAIVGAVIVSNIVVSLAAIVIVAGRQHSLYVLNHDASHGRQFMRRSTNRWVGFLVAVLPMMHHPEAWSFGQWQRRHRLHHRHLFTALDPDYEGRRIQGDTIRRYTRAQLVWACARTGLTSLYAFFNGRQDSVLPSRAALVRHEHHHLRTLFLPFRGDPELELERRLKLGAYVGAAVVLGVTGAWTQFLLYWTVPMYTVYPALLHAMDLTEHRWRERSNDLDVNTRSTLLSWVARAFLGCLQRPQHRAHHHFPGVPVGELPELSRLLAIAGLSRPSLVGFASMLPDLGDEEPVAAGVVEPELERRS